MNEKDLLIQEIKDIPEPLVHEVLDFVRFLKSKAVQETMEARRGRGIARSVNNEQGNRQEMLSERETAYLLKSDAMRQRLLAAVQRQEGIPFDEALEKLGIRPSGV